MSRTRAMAVARVRGRAAVDGGAPAAAGRRWSHVVRGKGNSRRAARAREPGRILVFTIESVHSWCYWYVFTTEASLKSLTLALARSLLSGPWAGHQSTHRRIRMGVRRLLALARRRGRLLAVEDLAGKAVGVDISILSVTSASVTVACCVSRPNLRPIRSLYRAAATLTLDELREGGQRAASR